MYKCLQQNIDDGTKNGLCELPHSVYYVSLFVDVWICNEKALWADDKWNIIIKSILFVKAIATFDMR